MMSLTLTRRYNVDRFGYLIPHRYGNLPMVGAVATYRPGEGRFGRGAVAVEEGTTNLWRNPGWLDGTLSGWIAYSTGGATGERQVVPDGRFGYALRLTKVDSGAGWWGVHQNETWHQTGSVIADSVYVKVISASNGARLSLYSDYINSGGSRYWGMGWNFNLNTFGLSQFQGTAKHTPVGDGWYRIEFVTAEGDIVGGASYYCINGAPAEVLLAYPQKEAKPFATSFVNGTRASGRLGYEQFPEGPFTVAVWGKTFDSRAVSRLPFGKWTRFYYGVNAWNKLLLSWIDSTNTQRTASGSITIDPLDWHFYVLTWDGTTLIGYVDGVEHVRATPDMAQRGGTFGWGNISGASSPAYSSPWNGLLDEGLILPYVASEEEIVSWYEAQGPLPPHPQALLQWDWQAVRPAQMVKL